METGAKDAGAVTNADRTKPQVRMVAMALRFGLLLLLIAVLASALMWYFAASARPSPAKAIATATSTATVGPTATATPNITFVGMNVAWGKVAARTLPTAFPNNRALIFEQAATPDGQWLVCADAPRAENNTTQYSYLVLYNVASGRIRIVSQLATPQSQVLFASVDQHWLVWTEGTDAMSGGNWGMFSYNLDTGRVVQLADRLPANSLPYTSAVVDHGYAIWQDAVGPVTPDNPTNLRIRLEDLASGAVQTLAQGAVAPLLSWPWSLWTQYDNANAYHAVARNLVTGQTVAFPAGLSIMALAGTSTVEETPDSAISLYDDFAKDVTQPRVLIQAVGADHVTFATLNDRIVALNEDAIGLVYDRAEQRLVEVSASPHVSAWVGGRLLIWQEPESQAQQAKDPPHDISAPTLEVIDTTTLPAPPA